MTSIKKRSVDKKPAAKKKKKVSSGYKFGTLLGGSTIPKRLRRRGSGVVNRRKWRGGKPGPGKK